jgi:hypothetical protein
MAVELTWLVPLSFSIKVSLAIGLRLPGILTKRFSIKDQSLTRYLRLTEC